MGGSSRYRARAAKLEVDRQHREALEAERRNREAMEADWVPNKSLYICTYENRALFRMDPRVCYSVQAIKLSDLFSFSETPITISYSKSLQSRATSISEDKLLRKVDYIYGRRVPRKMGFGVFGSQIVLAGGGKASGGFRATTRVYVLETGSSVGDGTLKFIKGSSSVEEVISANLNPITYFLNSKQGNVFPCLWGSKLWAPRSWPLRPHPGYIVGLGMPVFCFDVGEPTAPRRERLVHDHDHWNVFPEALILDLEDDDHKVLFAPWGGASIKVYHMKLSNDESIPLVLECVATMYLHCDYKHYSSSFAHLGGREVCVMFLDNWIHYKMRGFSFTFECSFLKSAASPESSDSKDPYFTLRNAYNSSFRSFSAKSLGWRNFEYNWSRESFPCCARFCGCAVL